jgi:hypothetical protein
MDADARTRRRGAELLIEHCYAIAATEAQPTAFERLERVVGGHLARLLVGALAGGRRSPKAATVDRAA